MIQKNLPRLLVRKERIANIAITLILLAFTIVLETISQNTTGSFVNRQIEILFLAIVIYCYIIISAFSLIKRIDLFQIFLFSSFFFFFGRHILLLFNSVPTDGTLFKSVISEETYISTGFFIIEAMLCVHIGYLLIGRSFVGKSEIYKNNVDILQKENDALKWSGWVFFAITVLPYLSMSIKNIRDTFIYGYGYRITELSKESATFVSIVSGAMLPALMAIYITKRKQSKLPIILLGIYFALYTLSGSRINTFCYLLSFIYLYIYWRDSHKAISWKKIFILVSIFAFSFSVVSNARGITSSTANMPDLLRTAVSNVWNNNPITSALYEMGNTFVATAGVLQFCPSDVPHLKGVSYICNFIYIIPNAWTNNFTANFLFTDDAISGYLVPYGGVGSSFVAEAYYNFGRSGLIIILLIGIIWGLLCKKTEEYLLRGNVIKFFLSIGFFITIIFMVRSDLVYRFRPFVWDWVSLAGLAYLISKSKSQQIKSNKG